MKKLLCLLLPVLLLSACTNYGKKVKSGNVEVYYKEGVSKEEAQKTADLFLEAIKAANGDSKGRKSFQLSKPGDSLLLKMAVDVDRVNDVPEENFYAIMYLISDSIFGGKPVNMELTDTKFKAVKNLAYKKQETAPSREKVTAGNVELFYDPELGGRSATGLANLLNGYIEPEETNSFYFGKNEEGGFLVKMVVDPSKTGQVSEDDLRGVCEKISGEILNGAPLTYELCDATFHTLKTYNYPGKP